MPCTNLRRGERCQSAKPATDVRFLKRIGALTSQAFDELIDPSAGIIAIRGLAESMRSPGFTAALAEATVGKSSGTVEPLGQVVDALADGGGSISPFGIVIEQARPMILH